MSVRGHVKDGVVTLKDVLRAIPMVNVPRAARMREVGSQSNEVHQEAPWASS